MLYLRHARPARQSRRTQHPSLPEMPTLGHVDQQQRLRNLLRRALSDCAYEATRHEPGGMLVLEARRQDGRAVHVRFRGVQSVEASPDLEVGAPLRLASVTAGRSLGTLFRLLLPRVRPPVPADAWRVSFRVGEGSIDVVCQDAEWWEDG